MGYTGRIRPERNEPTNLYNLAGTIPRFSSRHRHSDRLNRTGHDSIRDAILHSAKLLGFYIIYYSWKRTSTPLKGCVLWKLNAMVRLLRFLLAIRLLGSQYRYIVSFTVLFGHTYSNIRTMRIVTAPTSFLQTAWQMAKSITAQFGTIPALVVQLAIKQRGSISNPYRLPALESNKFTNLSTNKQLSGIST